MDKLAQSKSDLNNQLLLDSQRINENFLDKSYAKLIFSEDIISELNNTSNSIDLSDKWRFICIGHFEERRNSWFFFNEHNKSVFIKNGLFNTNAGYVEQKYENDLLIFDHIEYLYFSGRVTGMNEDYILMGSIAECKFESIHASQLYHVLDTKLLLDLIDFKK